MLSLTLSASHGFFELSPGYSRIFSASSCCKHRVPLGLCASKAKHSGATQVIVSRRGNKVKTGGSSCYKPRKREVSKLLISLGETLKDSYFRSAIQDYANLSSCSAFLLEIVMVSPVVHLEKNYEFQSRTIESQFKKRVLNRKCLGLYETRQII